MVHLTDEDSLKYLVDVRYEYLKGFKGFRLVFHFAKNPYFLNSEITKEYYVENLFRGEPLLMRMGG